MIRILHPALGRPSIISPDVYIPEVSNLFPPLKGPDSPCTIVVGELVFSERRKAMQTGVNRTTVHSGRHMSGKVCYFIDVRQAVNGRYYMVLTESRRKGDQGFEQSRVMVFEEDISGLLEEVDRAGEEALRAIEDRGELPGDSIKEEHPRAFSRWTEEDEETLRSRFENGSEVEAIARILGRTEQAILARLEKMGLVDESPERQEAGA